MTRDEFAALDTDAAARVVARLIADHEYRYEIVSLLRDPDSLPDGVPDGIRVSVRRGLRAQVALEAAFARPAAQLVKALIVETRPSDWRRVLGELQSANENIAASVIDGLLKDLDEL